MSSPAAVGVDDDLPAGQASVAHGATQHELTRRVDQQPVVRRVQSLVPEFREHRVDDLLADIRRQRAVEVDALRVLVGQHHCVEPHRRIALVLDRNLCLAVRPQVVQHAALADLGKPA